MTPTHFAHLAQKWLLNVPHVQTFVRNQSWIESMGMGSFLSVSKGSDEPLQFLELVYRPIQDQGIHALVGKGVTFDSGGISIKPSADMSLMKGDMAGAATVLSCFYTAAQQGLGVNLVAVIPLTENLINGKATKPGDIVKAMNGKTIEVDNTDAEGRLILADALYYVTKEYSPLSVVELSTLTGAMDIALGFPFAGVFTNSDSLWNQLEKAGKESGDRVWRMPLDNEYKKQIKSDVADLKNVGGRSAGSCTAAVFLTEFLHEKEIPFAHIDIAGVFHQKGKGMTGRPCRMLMSYIANLCQHFHR